MPRTLPPGTPSRTRTVEKAERDVRKDNEKQTAKAIHALKSEMMGSQRLSHVLNKIMDAALDDEHKHQAAAWKIVMDRALPQTVFEQEVSKGQTRNAIQINISTMGQSTSTDIIEGELTDD